MLIEVDPLSREIVSRQSLEEFVDNRLAVFKQRKQEELLPQVQEKVRIHYFQENIRDLIAGAVTLSSPQQHLSAENRERFYARLVDRFRDLARETSLQRQLPEVEQLTLRLSYPDEAVQIQRIRTCLSTLTKGRYLPKGAADTVLRLLTATEPKGMLTATPPAGPPPTSLRSVSPRPLPAPQDRENQERFRQDLRPSAQKRSGILEYLTIIFEQEAEIAGRYADFLTLSELEDFHDRLSSIVGNQNVLRLVQQNHGLLTYPSENVFTKYLTTLSLVKKKLETNGGRRAELQERFGLEKSLACYAHLESLLQLKRELFAELGVYGTAPEEPERQFDLEVYKNQLLQRAGLDGDIVRAYTHGKTAKFVGEFYAPMEYFRKNAIGKVEQQKLDLQWEEVFWTMVHLNAITRKHKANPLYRLNPHLDEVTSKYLREYLRVTLYAAQILAQEGEIRPLLNLNEE